jgi:energy-coupling factor transport system ATP-binding protein
VRYHYPGAGWILNGVDLSISPGEYRVIFGANGSGKSTLGYLLNGLIPHFFGGTLKGTVTVNGIDTRHSSVSQLFPQIGLVIQNADAQLFSSTVENELAFGLESIGASPDEIENRITHIAESLDIGELLNRSPETLSGGEKRLVSIAAVLCLNPLVMILDEPYANLDWKGVRRVRNLLSRIHHTGKTVVVIEQRLGNFLGDADQCLIMDQGMIRFEGDAEQARQVLRDEGLAPCYPKRRRRDTRDNVVLAVENLSYTVNGRQILNNISLELRQGETVAIVGENGAGKTTLIRHFIGLLKPDRGTVFVHGQDISGIPPAALANDVGICFQNPNDQFFKSTVKDELLAGPRAIGKKEEGVEDICDTLNLHGLLERSPYRLSEGEKKRVAVASVLAMRPDILVLDEPTAGQDGRFKQIMADMIIRSENSDTVTVIITHDLDFARAVADRWIVLHDGQVAADGPFESIQYENAMIPDKYEN